MKEQSMKKTLLTAVMLCSAVAFAAPPPAGRPPPQGGPLQGDERGQHREEREKRVRMMLVVGIADALSLTEAEALRMGDKIKGFEDRRRPVREAMHESMKTLKAASDGDPAALPQVDAAVQKVLDGRQQMAQLDKEMFAGLSQGLTPQKRAQLAIFLARFHQGVGKMKGQGGQGRRAHGRGNAQTDF
jgi:Spy/CpxP family protein refolding chaperone